MHLLLISDYYKPIIKSGAIIIEDLALEFIKQGHRVTVVTFTDLGMKTKTCSDQDSVTVIRIPSPLRKFGKFGRLIAECLYSTQIDWALRKEIKHQDFDGIICYSPSIFYGSAIKKLKERLNVKVYLIIRDIFPKWVVDAGLIKEGLLFYFFKKIESRLYLYSDYIGIESKQDLDYFYKNADQSKIKVLSNWASEEIEFSEDKPPYLSEDKVKILYGGNIGDAQDLYSLIKSIDQDSLEGGEILILGSGNQTEDIKNLIQNEKISDIHYLGEVPRSKYLQFLNHCDIGLVSLNKELKSNNFPLKMMGYIQLGKPLIASVNKDNEIINLINDYKIGEVSLSENTKSFNVNLKKMIRDEKLRKSYGSNAIELFKNKFTVSIAAKEILENFIS